MFFVKIAKKFVSDMQTIGIACKQAPWAAQQSHKEFFSGLGAGAPAVQGWPPAPQPVRTRHTSDGGERSGRDWSFGWNTESLCSAIIEIIG